MTAAHSPTMAAINQRRFQVQFYTITAYGKRMTRAAVMTLAQIEATAAANGWRVCVGECVG